MTKAFDAIVVGARCAGSSTAMLLARKGYRVLPMVISPRYKMRTQRSEQGGIELITDSQIRHPQPGDIGWIISMHGKIYSAEFGFDPRFEIHIAAKMVDFFNKVDSFNSIWVSEVEGERASSIAVSKLPDGKGFVNFVLVTQQFRGHGIARSLMEAAIEHARKNAVATLRLETYSVKAPAKCTKKWIFN
jgi:GNAT superfamily N-acetyltransferase